MPHLSQNLASFRCFGLGLVGVGFKEAAHKN